MTVKQIENFSSSNHSEASFFMDWVIVIIGENTLMQIEIFHHRLKVIHNNCFLVTFFQGDTWTGPLHYAMIQIIRLDLRLFPKIYL